MRRPILLLLPLLAAGCMTPEPFDRQGTWRATGANEANLRAMAVDPSHLDRGIAPATPTRGEAAVRGIRRGQGQTQPPLPTANQPASANPEPGGQALPPPMGNQNVRR